MIRASRGGGPLSFVVVAFRFRELPADLAARIQRRRVHMGVGVAGAHRGEDLVELTGHDLLACRARRDDVGRRNGPGDRPGWLRAKRGERRDRGRRGSRRRLAQPHDDASVDAGLCKMDVGLLHCSNQAAERQLVIERLVVTRDVDLEPPARGRGYRGNLLETDQIDADAVLAVCADESGHRYGHEYSQGDMKRLHSLPPFYCETERMCEGPPRYARVPREASDLCASTLDFSSRVWA